MLLWLSQPEEGSFALFIAVMLKDMISGSNNSRVASVIPAPAQFDWQPVTSDLWFFLDSHTYLDCEWSLKTSKLETHYQYVLNQCEITLIKMVTNSHPSYKYFTYLGVFFFLLNIHINSHILIMYLMSLVFVCKVENRKDKQVGL